MRNYTLPQKETAPPPLYAPIYSIGGALPGSSSIRQQPRRSTRIQARHLLTMWTMMINSITKRYTPTSSGHQEMNFIPQGDIHRLAAKSELPRATVRAGEYKVSWKAVTASRLDTTALKAALPDVYGQFCRTTTSRRFTISA